MNNTPVPEEIPFSRPVKVSQISAKAQNLRLAASEAELEGLARLWNVLSVGSLTADLQASRWKKDGIRFSGRVHCELVQACVVTLEPVPAVIDEEIDQVFAPEGSRLASPRLDERGEMIIDVDAPDLPDVFVGDSIDVGVVIAEFAALGIDPWPRKTGVVFEEYNAGGTGGDDRPPSPFAALEGWKKREE